MEAHHSSTPLLLLTADRPPELRDSSENQTTDQVKIFQNFVRFQFDLDSTMPDQAIRSKIAQSVFRASCPHPGPVQINCPFREPLYQPDETQNSGTPITLRPASFNQLPAQVLPDNGIVLIGRLPKRSDITAALKQAKKLNWPVFSSILSNARVHSPDEQIFHFEYLLDEAPEVDCALHIGERLTSKKVMEWLTKEKPSSYIHISPYSHWYNPSELVTERIYASIDALNFTSNTGSSWLARWKELDAEIEGRLDQEPITFSETVLMRTLSKLELANWGVFLGSSMPIREAELNLFPKNALGFFSQRGVSGIDGNIASIAGLAKGLNAPVLAVIGDMTALYDLNSLHLIKDLPVVLIISNNGGGGIFSHLKVAKDPAFEKLFAFSHEMNFEHGAKLFDLEYEKIDSEETLLKSLEQALQKKRACILEVVTSRVENAKVHKRMKQICSIIPV
jgi:2-succinyl-5-enolpyruvyl-6-hydroxy-3-cyclohexene-1-carboxylate synthase